MNRAGLLFLLLGPNFASATATETACIKDSLMRLEEGRCVPVSAPGIFNQPVEMAFGPDGIIFVASVNNGRVFALSNSGIVKSSWAVDGGPLGLAYDDKRRVLYCSTTRNRISRFSVEGRDLGDLIDLSDQYRGLRSIALTRAGTVFAAESDANLVLEISPKGQILRRIGKSGTGIGEFRFPQRIAVDSNDNLWVVELTGNRIQKITPDGRASIPPIGIDNPHALGVAKGSIFFTSRGRDIFRYDIQAGKATKVADVPHVLDVKLGPASQIYILIGHGERM